MWTKEHRARQAAFERQRRYPTDLTDAEWEWIRSLLPKPARRGRPPGVDLREVLNAIRYLARAGCGWRMLPTDFGPWQTVYWWFRRFVRCLLFRTIHDLALMIDRERTGREASPTAGVLDSQTVKAPAAPAGAATTRPRGSRGASGTLPWTPTGGSCWCTSPRPTCRTRTGPSRSSPPCASTGRG